MTPYMEWLVYGLMGVLILLVGFFGGRISMGGQLDTLRNERNDAERKLSEETVRREMELQAAAKLKKELEDVRGGFESTFNALSAEALRKNNEQFLELAQQVFGRLQEGAKGDLEKRQQAIHELIAPIRRSLDQVDEKIGAVEKARESAYTGLQEQIRNLLESQGTLQKETNNLVFALKTPNVRGHWGEMQLERTVEFAGLTEYVDFVQQKTPEAEATRLRPDLIVKLPGSKHIVVDAKAPLAAYLETLETEDGERRVQLLQRHAKQIRAHIKVLSSKQYWRQFDPSPEFVVLFLPGEAFFSAALEQDPSLIEYGAGENVLLATPTTLIALLKAAAYGWKQETMAREAKEISDLGRQLYERVVTQTEHYEDVGRSLRRSVDAYNKSIRSMESRVLVTARKLAHLSSDNTRGLPETLVPVEENPLSSVDE